MTLKLSFKIDEAIMDRMTKMTNLKLHLENLKYFSEKKFWQKTIIIIGSEKA